MNTITLTQVVDGTSTNVEGVKLYYAIKPLFDLGESICLDLTGTLAFSTSFLNSSIGELIDIYGVAFFRKNFCIRNFSKAQANMLKNYIQDVIELQSS